MCSGPVFALLDPELPEPELEPELLEPDPDELEPDEPDPVEPLDEPEPVPVGAALGEPLVTPEVPGLVPLPVELIVGFDPPPQPAAKSRKTNTVNVSKTEVGRERRDGRRMEPPGAGVLLVRCWK